MQLRRLTPDQEERAPFFVLNYAERCGTPIVQNNLSDKDLPGLARFLNPEKKKWLQEQVSDGINLLLQIRDRGLAPLPSVSLLKELSQVNIEPKSLAGLDPVLLFLYCENHHINCDHMESKEELVQALLKFSPNNIPEQEVTYLTLDKARTKKEPKTKTEIISFAAVRYGYDLSRLTANWVSWEFSRMKFFEGCYFPLHPNIVRLSRCFNPLFSPRHYPNNRLARLFYRETGERLVLTANMTLAYSRLQEIALSKNFYLGRLPMISNTTTPFFEDEVEEISKSEIISYGVLIGNENSSLDPGKGLIAMSIAELYNMIKTEGLVCSLDKEKYPIKSLHKLIRMNLNPEIRILITTLLNHLELMLTAQLKQSEAESMLRLLDIGWKMRGWKGSKTLPYSEIQCRKLSDEELLNLGSEIKVLTSNQYEWFSFPVVRFETTKYELFNFLVKSHNISTIGDRLELILRNDDTFSCVRLNSQIIISCACCYLDRIGVNHGVDISKVERIV